MQSDTYISLKSQRTESRKMMRKGKNKLYKRKNERIAYETNYSFGL